MPLPQENPGEYFMEVDNMPEVIGGSQNIDSPIQYQDQQGIRYVVVQQQQDNKLAYVLVGGMVLISVVAIVALAKK